MSEDDFELIQQVRTAEEQVTDVEPAVEQAVESEVVEEKPVTPTALAEALKQIFPQQQQQPPKEEPKKLSPEEFKARFRVWEPDDNHIANLTSGDPAKVREALIALRDGLIEQSVAMNYGIMQLQLTPFQDQMNQLNESQQQQVRTASRQQFFDKYPHFKGKEPILNAVTSALTASGTFNPKSMDDAHKQIAQKAEEMMRLVDPNYVTPTEQQPKQKQPTTKTQMVSTSRGGQGGTGGSVSAAKKPLELSIWD